jgi:hypothetical protein
MNRSDLLRHHVAPHWGALAGWTPEGAEPLPEEATLDSGSQEPEHRPDSPRHRAA